MGGAETGRGRAALFAVCAVWGLALVVTAGLWALLQAERPAPFGTGGDSFLYYLPTIRQAQLQLLEHGRPVIEWRLGQGMNPFESGQLGVGYPPYVAAALITEATATPAHFLDVSALLTALLTVLVVLGLGRRLPLPARAVAAVACAVAPGAVLYGLASHDFYTPLPWVCALLFVALDLVDAFDAAPDARRAFKARPTLRLVLAAALCELLLFWCSHPQMFGMTNILLALVCVGTSRRAAAGLWATATLAGSALPVVVPLAHYGFLSTIAAEPTRREHHPLIAYRTSVDPTDGLRWLVAGLFGGDDRAWHGGAMLWNPPLLALVGWGLVTAVRRRSPWPLLSSTAALWLLLPRLLPEPVRFPIPFITSMRWPDKLASLLGPLSLLLVVVLLSRRGPRGARAALVVATLMLGGSVVGSAQGQRGAPLRPAHAWGAPGIVEETLRCFQELGIKAGVRTVLVDKWDRFPTRDPHPLPILGAAGNAPLLFGGSTAHLYEPLEPQATYAAHLRLSSPWRGVVRPERLLDPGYQAGLRALGVRFLLAEREASLRAFSDDVRACTDALGLVTYAAPLPNPAPFPALLRPDYSVVPLLVDGAALQSRDPTPPPATGIARLLHRPLETTADGRLRVTPRLLPAWVVPGALVVALAWLGSLFALWRRAR